MQEGLTLTAASDVAFVQYPWNPSQLSQRVDRVHRIGAKAESIGVHYLLAKNTIEEKKVRILHEKQQISDAVIDGGEVEGNTDIFEDLLNIYSL